VVPVCYSCQKSDDKVTDERRTELRLCQHTTGLRGMKFQSLPAPSAAPSEQSLLNVDV